MKPRIRITPLLLIFIMAGGLQSQPPTGLQSFGLDGKNIGWLAAPSTHVSARPYLYATTAEGIFRRDISNPDSTWMNLGLEGKHITAIDIQVRGIGPAIFQTPIVAVSIDYPSPDSIPIYRLVDQTWVQADSGIIDVISALASFASSGHEPPGLAFAAGLSGLLFRASTANSVWTEIYNGGIGPGFTVLQAHQTETGKTIWVGGFDSHSYLALFGKLDENGEVLLWGSFPRTSLESSCYAFAFHPYDSQRVYAAVTGAVLRTQDGGMSWQFTGLHDEQTDFYNLCADRFIPGYLFAVGASHADNISNFWESRDDGETWQEIQEISELSPQGMRLLADPKEEGSIYIGTAGKGIWQYRLAMVSVAARENSLPISEYALSQNYPNPFSIETRIRINLPRNAPVKIQVFNTAGQEVRLLHEASMNAGVYDFHWDGRNQLNLPVPNGVYFYRLETSQGTVTRKMLLFRVK